MIHMVDLRSDAVVLAMHYYIDIGLSTHMYLHSWDITTTRRSLQVPQFPNDILHVILIPLAAPSILPLLSLHSR
jgi:hypothetical protein